MSREFKVLPGGHSRDEKPKPDISPSKMLMHVRNVNSSVLKDAQNVWGEIWDQIQGSLTHGVMVDPKVEKGFVPECGWPEFCEKLWLLKHYLDYARRFSEGKV